MLIILLIIKHLNFINYYFDPQISAVIISLRFMINSKLYYYHDKLNYLFSQSYPDYIIKFYLFQFINVIMAIQIAIIIIIMN